MIKVLICFVVFEKDIHISSQSLPSNDLILMHSQYLARKCYIRFFNGLQKLFRHILEEQNILPLYIKKHTILKIHLNIIANNILFSSVLKASWMWNFESYVYWTNEVSCCNFPVTNENDWLPDWKIYTAFLLIKSLNNVFYDEKRQEAAWWNN